MDAQAIVRTVRADAGLTLRGLAALAGTSHSTLAAYEAGRKTPTVSTLERIVRSAGFEMDVTLRRRYRHAAVDRGDELVAVLELASQFPARHSPRLEAPVFGSAV